MSFDFIVSPLEGSVSDGALLAVEAKPSQSHGKRFEKDVLALKNLEDSANPTSIFDAPYNAFEKGSALSVKTTCRGIVDLADASRIWTMPSTLKIEARRKGGAPRLLMVIGEYDQVGDNKQFKTVHELLFEFNDATCAKLYGGVYPSDVTAVHNLLKSEYGRNIEEAKLFAEDEVNLLNSQCGVIRLAAKISDSGKKQRRIQCSAKLSELAGAALEHRVYSGNYFGWKLPQEYSSRPRSGAAKKSIDPSENFCLNEALCVF